MSMNNQGRPSQPGTVQDNDIPTISGGRTVYEAPLATTAGTSA